MALVAAASCSLLVATSSVAVAAPAAAAAAVPAAQGTPVDWAPCGDRAPGLDCATYSVPLDHADPGSPGLELALVRLPATDTAHRVGSLFVNPGGPGGSGVELVVAEGQRLAQLTRGRFDIVGFDPRGVGASTPVRCFESTAEAALALPGLNVDVVPDSPEEVVERTATVGAYTSLCGQRNAALLPYISTDAVARDLDLLRAAVGDEQLTYYGISYGTLLGQTYANIFPGRVRAMALDGVIDPRGYSAGFTPFLRDSLTDSDKTLQGFFDTCEAAGPQRCALAGKNGRQVARDLLARIRRDGPLPATGAHVPGVVGEDDLVGVVFNVLFSPAAWPALASALDTAASTGDGSALLDLVDLVRDGPGQHSPQDLLDAPYSNENDALEATLCNDTGDAGDAAHWPAAAARASSVSSLFGPYKSWTLGLPCATWPSKAVARYTGPWTARTANPVLLIGNTSDPITPLASARAVERLLPGSRLLVHDGYGHSSLAPGQTSTCSLTHLSAYLVAKKLPGRGTVCEPDSAPFPPVGGATGSADPQRTSGVTAG